MASKVRVIAIVIAIGILAGIAALVWPRPCTPDKDCVEYKNINNALYGNGNAPINTGTNVAP